MLINLEQVAGLAMSLLKLQLQEKLKAQGYGTPQSSSLIRSIEPEIRTVATVVVGSMYMNDYYQFVEEGVPAASVPFTPGSRRGGTSKYIQGLISFFRRKVRLGFKEAVRASFATANKHKREGIPLRTSLKYSRDGTRLNFIKDTLKEYLPEVEKLIQRQIGNEIELTFSAMLRTLSIDGLQVTV